MGRVVFVYPVLLIVLFAESLFAQVRITPPVIASISPNTTVLPGQQITITGANFLSTQGTVTVGNYANWWNCTINQWNSTKVVVTVP